MRCPRCGLVNSPDITACARCGLPVPRLAPPLQGDDQAQPQEPPRQVEYPPPGQPHEPGVSHHQQLHTTAYPVHGPPGQAGSFPGQPSQPSSLQPQPGQFQGPPSQFQGQPGQFQGPPGQGQRGYVQPTQPAYRQGPAPYSPPLVTTPTSPSGAKSPSSKAAIPAALMGALLSLGYAAWAFTARRGIFQDFADGELVTPADAQSSDNVDTAFLLVAGIVAVIALLMLTRELLFRTRGTWPVKLTGLVVGMVGAVIVFIGLVLANGLADPGSQSEQGDRGVLATLVVGGGFVLMALGLLIGAVGVRGHDH